MTTVSTVDRTAIRAYGMGLLISLAAALVVVLAAIDVQSGRIPDREGHGWSLARLFGPDFSLVTNRQGWTVITTPNELTSTGLSRFHGLLNAHLMIDSIFAVVYAILIMIIVRAATRDWWRTIGTALTAVLLVADLVENVLAYELIFSDGGITPVLVATVVKWSALVGVVLLIVLRLVVPQRADRGATARRFLSQAVKAVIHQRFSFLPVVAIFALSVPTGAAILEQLPDAQRRWVFDGATGTRHAVWAILATLLLGLFLLAVGRRRTRKAIIQRDDPNASPSITAAPVDESLAPTGSTEPIGPVTGHGAGAGRAASNAAGPTPGRMLQVLRERATLGIWLIGPVLAVVTALIAVVAGHGDLVQGWRLVAFCVPLVGVVISSAIIRKVWDSPLGQRNGWERPNVPTRFNDNEIVAVGLCGTIAGVSAIVVGGLSLIRAFTPLVVLPDSDYMPPTADAGAVHTSVAVLLVVGAVALVSPWLVMIAMTRRFGGPTRGRNGWQHHRPGIWLITVLRTVRAERPARFLWRHKPWLLLFATVTIFVGLAFVPLAAAKIGLAATATLAIGSLTGMISAAGLVIQDRPTPEVFRLLGFRRTPLVSILVVIVVVVGLVAGNDGIHEVNRGTPVTSPQADSRTTLDDAYRAWYDSAAACEVEVGGRKVRPMIMIAAEGGGIRASYWTVRGLQAIRSSTVCGDRSTFFSGGASGGSVGLTVARFSGTSADPGTQAAVDAVKTMADSATLSRAADGTFVRDLLYGATGVPIPRIGETDGWDWYDRARLIEQGWIDGGSWGAKTFLTTPVGAQSAATGELILNSTSIKGNCRVWVSQVRLPDQTSAATGTENEGSFDPEKSCDKDAGPGPRTIDLFSAYGPYAGGQDSQCLGQVSAATAALLTARFPYVTPSGVVGPCPERSVVSGERSEPYWPQTQLVDGGYIENSGLATVTDLSDQWLRLVRDTNQRSLAGDADAPALVVPMVVFLTNGERASTQLKLGANPTSEFAVPPVAFIKGRIALSGNDALLARAQDAVDLAGFCPVGAQKSLCDTLDGRFPSRVVVVDRVTQPEIGAPLGWTMSEASITSLDKAMDLQVATTCAANAPRGGTAVAPPAAAERQPSCRAGFATLGDLARYYSGKAG